MKIKIKLIFSCFIVLLLVLLFLFFRFRSKAVIPFFFGVWDPIIFTIIGLIINKGLTLYSQYRYKKDGLSLIQLYFLYLYIFFYEYLNIIELKIISFFPNIFFKICKLCDKFLMFDYKLSQSNNILKKIAHKILMLFSVIPIVIGFCFDWYFLQWYWIFWGFCCSFFFHLFLVKLAYRWGYVYATWWVFTYGSDEDFKNFIQKNKG